MLEIDEDGFAFARLVRDGYVGWLSADALGEVEPAPTHRVAEVRTFLYAGPSLKQPIADWLSLRRPEVAVVETRGDYAHVPGRGLDLRAPPRGPRRPAGAGFRRGGRALPGDALPLGRGSRAWGSTARPGPRGPARGEAAPARATPTCKRPSSRTSSPTARRCAAATSCSGGGTWGSCRTERGSSTPIWTGT